MVDGRNMQKSLRNEIQFCRAKTKYRNPTQAPKWSHWLISGIRPELQVVGSRNRNTKKSTSAGDLFFAKEKLTGEIHAKPWNPLSRATTRWWRHHRSWCAIRRIVLASLTGWRRRASMDCLSDQCDWSRLEYWDAFKHLSSSLSPSQRGL